MLFGKILRSSEAHARITRLDVSKALALPGVRSVLTAQDIPQIPIRHGDQDRTMFADGEVRFRGEAIAAVAATSLEVAEAAGAGNRDRVRAAGHACSIPRRRCGRRAAGPCRLERLPGAAGVRPRGQYLGRSALGDGDLEAGFAQSYRIYEHRFTTQHVIPATRAARGGGKLGRQRRRHRLDQYPASFDMKNMLAEVLDLPASKVRVIVPGIGGGLAASSGSGVEHFAAWMARKSRRPVKVLTTSEEELTDAYPRQPTVIALKTGSARTVC